MLVKNKTLSRFLTFIFGYISGMAIMYIIINSYINTHFCDKSFGILYKKNGVVLICEMHHGLHL